MNRREHDDSQAFEEAWSGRASKSSSGWDAELADLVSTAEHLCRAAVVEPSDAFRTSLRVQLMTEAETVLTPGAVRTRKPLTRRIPLLRPSYAVRRRLAGATAAFVGAAGFVGLVGTSAQALPGDMLYPVKRGVENVELAFHQDDLSHGQFRLNQASERLAEAGRLTEENSPQTQSHVAETLDDFAVQAQDGSQSLFRSYGEDRSAQSVTVVNDFSAAAAANLAQLAGRLPSNADDSFQNAAGVVSELVTTASTLCSSCDTADVAGLIDAVSLLGDVSTTTAQTEPTAAPSEIVGDAPTAGAKDPVITVPKLPIIQSPAGSAPTANPPKVKAITDPAVGALLGDDDHEGIVPKLLNGLLGKNN